MQNSGYDKALINPVMFETNGTYIACGGVYSNNVNDNIDYGLNLQCQKFHENQWVLHNNMTLNTVRNSSGFSKALTKFSAASLSIRAFARNSEFMELRGIP